MAFTTRGLPATTLPELKWLWPPTKSVTAAGFTHQQFARGEIPRLQADFEEPVYATGGHIGQIQRCGTGAAEVCALGEQLADDVDVRRCVLLDLERKPVADGAIQIFGVGAAQAVTVELCAPPRVAVNSSLRIGS